MLRTARGMQGDTLVARDGEIGRVDQFYFDDEQWVVRYLVVDTGGWLTGRKVLISPIAITGTDWERDRVSVNLTRAQVEKSPDWDTEKPVSRQHEMAYHEYYGWPYYWGGIGIWGAGAYPGYLAHPPSMAIAAAEDARAGEGPVPGEREGDPHLRSTQEVIGYVIAACDGEIGHVDDFLIDDETWAIRYLAVDTGGWLPGKKVLVPPRWIEQVSWTEERVWVDLQRSAIQGAPQWDPSRPLTRAEEERFYAYFNRPPYWRSGS